MPLLYRCSVVASKCATTRAEYLSNTPCQLNHGTRHLLIQNSIPPNVRYAEALPKFIHEYQRLPKTPLHPPPTTLPVLTSPPLLPFSNTNPQTPLLLSIPPSPLLLHLPPNISPLIIPSSRDLLNTLHIFKSNPQPQMRPTRRPRSRYPRLPRIIQMSYSNSITALTDTIAVVAEEPRVLPIALLSPTLFGSPKIMIEEIRFMTILLLMIFAALCINCPP